MNFAIPTHTGTSDTGAEQRTYRLVPPYTEDGVTHSHVTVSAVYAMFSGPETYIFPSDADGEISSFGELDGSFQGGLDHEQALAGMGDGYTIATDIIAGEVVES